MPPKQIFVARQGSMGEHVEWAVSKTGICVVSMWPPTGPGRVRATVRVKKPEDDPAVAVRAKLVQLGWEGLLPVSEPLVELLPVPAPVVDAAAASTDAATAPGAQCTVCTS